MFSSDKSSLDTSDIIKSILPGTGLFGAGLYLDNRANKIKELTDKWLESFKAIPGITTFANNKLGVGEKDAEGVLKTFKSGISDLKTLHPASTTDAAAKAYAEGANKLLNTWVGPVKIKHILSAEHKLDALKDSPFFSSSSYKNKSERADLFNRLKTIIKSPSKLMTEHGALTEDAAESLKFNKEHYSAYANKNLKDPKSLKWLSTHQYKDVATTSPFGIDALFNGEHITGKDGKAVIDILSDYNTSYTDKEKLLKELNLNPKSVEAKLADAILHGAAPSQGNKHKAGGTGLFPSSLKDWDSHQGGARQFTKGVRDHAFEARKAQRTLHSIAKKLKYSAPAVSGAGLIAAILNKE